MDCFYDRIYFEKYGGEGYSWANSYPILRPFVAPLLQVMRYQGKAKSSPKVLDVGCAKGYLVKLLRELGIEAWGVDISEYAIANAPSNVKPYLRRINVEEAVLPFQNVFCDLVISTSTFEHLHLRKLPFVISQLRRILKPAGLLIINVPNPLIREEVEKRSCNYAKKERVG